MEFFLSKIKNVYFCVLVKWHIMQFLFKTHWDIPKNKKLIVLKPRNIEKARKSIEEIHWRILNKFLNMYHLFLMDVSIIDLFKMANPF